MKPFVIAKSFFILWFMVIASLHGCKDDEPTSALDGCCDTPAINGTIGNGHLYVANIITSNGDGINDLLWPNSDDNIIEIISFQIRDSEGNVVHEAMNEAPNGGSNGWDGRVNGQWINGVYDVRVQARSLDGTIGTLDGKVCNFRCIDPETTEPISSDGCQFPTQVNDGHYDSSIPTSEPTGCFN
jgi:CHU_C Type IX secretion signal domain